jgi:dTDP-4-amino-4,6-dideoxygalactose transaminase
MFNHDKVPFNDLTRIHEPLLEEFKSELARLVRNSSLVLGEGVSLFEEELAHSEGSDYAIGVNNGTSAIELALRALGIGKGDEVITTAFTFVATCFSILQTGAIPVLVDIDPLTGLLNPMEIERAINPRTKALVLVTLHGRVEGLDQIQGICKAHDIRFVIDGAQSHLGTFNGKPQIEFCDAVTLSFYPGKNLGALGEGGAILTNSPKIHRKLLLMRDWGASEKYNHSEWGGNFRLEALQAAFLRIKLRELRKWTSERQRIASIYRQRINPKLLMNPTDRFGSHVYHIFSVHTQNREEFCEGLTQNKVDFSFHYPKAIHQQAAYLGQVLTPSELPNSEWLAKSTVSIPIFPGQTDLEVNRVVEVVNNIFVDTQN